MPGTPGTLLVDWAKRAEERGFSGLVTIDRIAYPNHDSLTTLAAAAAVTSRIGLMTNILLAPVYPAAVLAKVAASIDQISGGRFTLGLAPGSREDDYQVTGRDFHRRGADFDAGLELLHRAWRGEPVAGGDNPITPAPTHDNRVPIMFGGTGDKAIQRAVTALTYFSLGTETEPDSRGYLRHYYANLGEWADRIADGALRSEEAIRGAVKAFEDAGISELYFDPTVASLDQVDRLADAVL